MNAGQRRWIVRLLWLCAAVAAVMAVAARRPIDAGAAVVSSVAYIIFAQVFQRRTTL